MRKPDTILDEIHAIRHKIYDEIKDLTVEERVRRVNKIGKSAAEKYGFKIYSNLEDARRDRSSVAAK